MNKSNKGSINDIVESIFEIVGYNAKFIVIALAAIAVEMFCHWTEAGQYLSPRQISVLEFLSDLAFYADCLVYGFTVVTNAVKEMVKRWKEMLE